MYDIRKEKIKYIWMRLGSIQDNLGRLDLIKVQHFAMDIDINSIDKCGFYVYLVCLKPCKHHV